MSDQPPRFGPVWAPRGRTGLPLRKTPACSSSSMPQSSSRGRGLPKPFVWPHPHSPDIKSDVISLPRLGRKKRKKKRKINKNGVWRDQRVTMQDRRSSQSNPSGNCPPAGQWDLRGDGGGQLRLCSHFQPPGMRFKLKYFIPP